MTMIPSKIAELTGSPEGDRLLVFRAEKTTLGFIPVNVRNAQPSTDNFNGRSKVPREIRISTDFTHPESASRFSPAPFAVELSGNLDEHLLAMVRADQGWHHWSEIVFRIGSDGLTVDVDLEGHTAPELASKHVTLMLIRGNPGEDFYQLLLRGQRLAYPKAYDHPKKIHDWWKLPIFCGGGSQAGMAYRFEGAGEEPRHMAYCTQGLYEHWINVLETENMPFGTLIVDAGWSVDGGLWKPDRFKWPDMKGFIAMQHAAGRHVLLWIPLWFNGGLPERFLMKCDGVDYCADPTNPEYAKFLSETVIQLISPEGLDADGFKIDMLQCTPSEHQTFYCVGHWCDKAKSPPIGHPPIESCGKEIWGCEMLHLLQKIIYDGAKEVKPDALISSSTVHPCFHDVCDMVRLHDTGNIQPSTDVPAVMNARAQLVKATLPGHLIDMDNWIHTYYDKWLDYTLNSWKTGVPCLFFTEFFITSFQQNPTVCTIKDGDLKKIAAAWRQGLQQK